MILGSLPSLSSILALSAHPINVPSVSNTSTNRNAHITTKKSRPLKLVRAAEVKHCPKVSPIAPRLKPVNVGSTEGPV